MLTTATLLIHIFHDYLPWWPMLICVACLLQWPLVIMTCIAVVLAATVAWRLAADGTQAAPTAHGFVSAGGQHTPESLENYKKSRRLFTYLRR